MCDWGASEFLALRDPFLRFAGYLGGAIVDLGSANRGPTCRCLKPVGDALSYTIKTGQNNALAW